MKIASFDVANRSFAMCVAEYHDVSVELRGLSAKLAGSPNLEHVAQCLEKATEIEPWRLIALEVADILKGRKLKETSTVDRAALLYQYLSRHDELLADCDHFLIEYQMNTNDKSRTVSAQLLYHLAKFPGMAHIVGPALKNTISLKSDGTTQHQEHLSSHVSRYAANKSHTKCLMRVILSRWGESHRLNTIAKKNHDDAADALIMLIAWVYQNQ